MCFFKCKTFRCGHPGFCEMTQSCSSGCIPTGADDYNAGLYPSHACLGTEIGVDDGDAPPVREPFHCPTCHHIILARMRDLHHPINFALENGFQAAAYTRPPDGSPYLKQWKERLSALGRLDKEKRSETTRDMSLREKIEWMRANRHVPSRKKRCMTPGAWSVEDERTLLWWRLNEFKEKQGPIQGFGRFNREITFRERPPRIGYDNRNGWEYP